MPLLSDLLHEDKIAIMEKGSHEEVIEKLLSMSQDPARIKDLESFREAVWERENIVSTGLGLGLAIPHVRKPYVKDFVAVAVLIRSGVEWGAFDGKPIKFVILVASPEHTHNEYLQLLSKIVFLWKDDVKRRKILQAAYPKEIYTLIKNFQVGNIFN